MIAFFRPRDKMDWLVSISGELFIPAVLLIVGLFLLLCAASVLPQDPSTAPTPACGGKSWSSPILPPARGRHPPSSFAPAPEASPRPARSRSGKDRTPRHIAPTPAGPPQAPAPTPDRPAAARPAAAAHQAGRR